MTQQLELQTFDYRMARYRLRWHLTHCQHPLHPIRVGNGEQTVLLLLTDVINNTETGKQFIRNASGIAM